MVSNTSRQVRKKSCISCIKRQFHKLAGNELNNCSSTVYYRYKSINKSICKVRKVPYAVASSITAKAIKVEPAFVEGAASANRSSTSSHLHQATNRTSYKEPIIFNQSSPLASIRALKSASEAPVHAKSDTQWQPYPLKTRQCQLLLLLCQNRAPIPTRRFDMAVSRGSRLS